MVNTMRRREIATPIRGEAIVFFFAALLLLAVYRGASLNFAIESLDYDGYSMTTFVTDFSLPGWVEWIRRVAIFIVLGLVGYIAYNINGFSQSAKRHFFSPFLLLIVWRAASTALQMAYPEWKFFYLLEQNSLAAFSCSILMLIGFNEELWVKLSRAFKILSVPLSIFVIFYWLSWEGGNRAEGIRVFRGFVYLLSIVAWFSLFNLKSGRLKSILLGAIPVVALLVLGVATATRALFFYVFVMVFVFLFSRRHGIRVSEKILIFIASVFVFIYVFFSFSDLMGGAGAFGDRIGEDTRSEQLTAFFQKVPLYELVLGTPDAGHDERFRDDLNRWGIDSGFVTLLYVGGLPLLFIYFYLHIYPAIYLLRARLGVHDAAVLAVVLSSAVQMISSEMPSLTEGYLALLPLMGRCLYLCVQHKKYVRSSRFGRVGYGEN